MKDLKILLKQMIKPIFICFIIYIFFFSFYIYQSNRSITYIEKAAVTIGDKKVSKLIEKKDSDHLYHFQIDHYYLKISSKDYSNYCEVDKKTYEKAKLNDCIEAYIYQYDDNGDRFYFIYDDKEFIEEILSKTNIKDWSNIEKKLLFRAADEKDAVIKLHSQYSKASFSKHLRNIHLLCIFILFFSLFYIFFANKEKINK